MDRKQGTGLTRGIPVSNEGLSRALAYHSIQKQCAFGQQQIRLGGLHEKCEKWLTLALDNGAAGLVVCRELHIGYYLNEVLSQREMLGIEERTGREYHLACLSGGEEEVSHVECA